MMFKLILSKAPSGGQWRTRGPRRITAECLALVVLSAPAAAGGQSPAKDPAGPRYATLRIAPVNARIGPGEDYKALWTYQTKGVPVQIVEESDDWRRICDPEGGLAWVRARALDSRRSVMRVAPTDLPMRRAPSPDAKINAILAARATAAYEGCKQGWCKISVDHMSGWVRPGELWGLGEGRQCK